MSEIADLVRLSRPCISKFTPYPQQDVGVFDHFYSYPLVLVLLGAWSCCGYRPLSNYYII
jgi:hypothetical protein